MNIALIILCVIIIVLIALLIKFVLEYTKVIQEQITAYRKQLDSNTELISKDIVEIYNLISGKALNINNKLNTINNIYDLSKTINTNVIKVYDLIKDKNISSINKINDNITDILKISDNIADKLYNITNDIKTINDKVDEFKTKKQAKNSLSNKSTINKSSKQ